MKDINNILWTNAVEKITADFLGYLTPALRAQYEESFVFQSFVDAICYELANSYMNIKSAIEQLDISKAVNIFLDLWSSVNGMKRLENETDDEYRSRFFLTVMGDKVSNAAIRRLLTEKYDIPVDISDIGIGITKPKLMSNYYEISLTGVDLNFSQLKSIYDDAESLTAIGNIILRIVQNVNQLFYEEGIYGETYFQWLDKTGFTFTFSGSTKPGTMTIYCDNRRALDGELTFHANYRPNDIVSISGLVGAGAGEAAVGGIL